MQEEAQAYAKIIEGEIALAAGDARLAITKLAEANQLLDTWIRPCVLGRAYLTEGTPEALTTRADAEFDACLKRRGEALALFIDEEPTYGHVPMVYYYQGRVREALKSADFVESYKQYVALRGEAGEDALLKDIRSRLR